jgi:hypothetical protein
MSNTIRNKIVEMLDKQIEKGVEKYGHTLDSCPDDKFDWRTMALEELIDLVQYQEKYIRQLELSISRCKAPFECKAPYMDLDD